MYTTRQPLARCCCRNSKTTENRHLPSMSDLTALKIRKLEQQQELAKEFNLILTRQVSVFVS